VLGGSSAINAELFIQASKSGVDGWAKLGNPGWDWETLEPYYRKSYTPIPPAADFKEHLDASWARNEGNSPIQVHRAKGGGLFAQAV
jgi:choline dehydrogenase-like flavoprotein